MRYPNKAHQQNHPRVQISPRTPGRTAPKTTTRNPGRPDPWTKPRARSRTAGLGKTLANPFILPNPTSRNSLRVSQSLAPTEESLGCQHGHCHVSVLPHGTVAPNLAPGLSRATRLS